MNMKKLLTILFTSFVLILVSQQTVVFAVNENAKTFESSVKKAPMVFTGLGVTWKQQIPVGTSGEVEVRFLHDNVWSVWYPMEIDIDGPNEADYNNPSAFLPTNPTDTFQYRVVLSSNDPAKKPIIENLTFDYINTPNPTGTNSAGVTNIMALNNNRLVATTSPLVGLDTANYQGLRVISRSEWGADESLRLYKETNKEPELVKLESDFGERYADELKIVRTVDKDSQGRFLTWPLEYPAKVTKIIVHHTATTKDLDDPKKAIRDIYYWHTMSRGWGDIGYNFIIDPQGNIYEGRAGGDSVVGAHAGRGNVGSIGISVLGNYMDTEVPAPVQQALIQLINAKSIQYGIDPMGSSSFRGEVLPNIIGHRDIMSTSCPGDKLFARLNFIRVAVKGGIKPSIIDRTPSFQQNGQYKYEIADGSIIPTFEAGTPKTMELKLKNTGTVSWGPETVFMLNKNENSINFFRTDSNITSAKLGKEVKTGEIATIKITLEAGFKGGFTVVELFPMVNNKVKVEKYLSIPVEVKGPVYDYEVTKVEVGKPYLKPNEQTTVNIEMKNTGNTVWRKTGNGKVVLGADQPRDHINKLLLVPSNRLGTFIENEVAPGQTAHFQIQIKAGKLAGPYREYFTPLIDGVMWFTNKGNAIEFNVLEKDYFATLTSSSKEKTILPNGRKELWFEMQNYGSAIWKKEEMKFDIRNMTGMKVEKIEMVQATVKPFEKARIMMTVVAPNSEAFFTLQVKPKVNNNLILARPVSFFLKGDKNASATTISLPTATNTTPSTSVPATAPTQTSQSTSTGSTTATRNVRIDLAFRGQPTITSAQSFTMKEDSLVKATYTPWEKVTVSYNTQTSKYTVVSSKNTLTTTAAPRFQTSGGILKIDNFDRKASWDASIVYNEFRGDLQPLWYNNELHTINELTIEDYLKGTGETSETQPMEKLKAIITVARTYAFFYTTQAEKFPGAPFHLTDDPQTSQKYTGYGAEKRSPNAVKAVEATKNMVVTYNGKVVKTPYFSSDDGRTRSAEEVWGWKDTPYLQSVSDPYCVGKPMAGHGVGLSGCGSLGMAQAGKTWIEIIKYYYQGVEVKSL